MYEGNCRSHTPVTSASPGRNFAEIMRELTSHRVQMVVAGRGQRALIQRVVFLCRLQLLLIVALSAPSAIRAEYDILSVFHFRLPIPIIGFKTMEVKSTFLMRTIGKSYGLSMLESAKR